MSKVNIQNMLNESLASVQSEKKTLCSAALGCSKSVLSFKIFYTVHAIFKAANFNFLDYDDPKASILKL